MCVAQGHCAALYCTVGYSCILHRDIAQHFTVLLGVLVCCIGALRSTLFYCWVFLCFAQGHCAALYCTVGYSCVLHRDIARHFIVLLVILVCCTGACAALYCTIGYSCVLHRNIAQHFIVLLVILVCCTGTLRSTLLYYWLFLCVSQGHCTALYCTVGCSCVLNRDIAQHFIVLLVILVCCRGTLRSTLLYCWLFLCVAQGHCATLYFTVGYSCVLHRGIAQHFIVLLGILVYCTGTLRSTLLYCWVFLCVA